MARQAKLLETDDTIEEITLAGLDYISKRDRRMAAGRDEKEAKTALLEVMRAHRKRHYRDPEASLTVDVEQAEPTVKAKLFGKEEDEEEPEDDDESLLSRSLRPPPPRGEEAPQEPEAPSSKASGRKAKPGSLDDTLKTQ